MKYIYPIIILVLSIVFIAVDGSYFSLQPSINYFGLAAYGSITLIMIVTFFAIQKLTKSREIYLYLVAGFTFIYISLLLSTLDKIYAFPSNITDVLEDLFQLVGFGFVTVGIIKWIKFDEEIKHKLVELACVDGLTNIMNRRIFDIEFGREFSNAKRYGEDLSLISLDLDHFKKINDQYGHFFGDLALKSFTREVSQFLRTGDIFCRWGGDEFSIVLPRTDRENALKVAEKLRTVVKNISVRTDDSEIHFTVSLGVAGILPEDKDVSEMIERADRALYEAKKAGRDRTVLDKGAF
jgi:diguanylate cyclase (GGDEF)-like protein